MRLFELFDEEPGDSEYLDTAKNIILDYLLTLHSEDVRDVRTEQLVNELRIRGYDVTEDFVEQFLTDEVDSVENVENGVVYIDVNVPMDDNQEPKKPAEEIEKEKKDQRRKSAVDSLKNRDKKEKKRRDSIQRSDGDKRGVGESTSVLEMTITDRNYKEMSNNIDRKLKAKKDEKNRSAIRYYIEQGISPADAKDLVLNPDTKKYVSRDGDHLVAKDKEEE